MSENNIKVGEYIVIQKQNYRKLHKYNKTNSTLKIGNDTVNLETIEGCEYYSFFKMIPRGTKRNREFALELVKETLNLKDEIGMKPCGTDNRNIYDDGRSQKLSANEINELKIDLSSASDIVETLITNSNTFFNKTEFSQDKYLKRKEKKYSEYIQILRPNLRLISEILYKLDSSKVQGVRMDTLSQIITMANISCDGNHLLYDSGSNGLIVASLLSAIGEKGNGRLLNMHPGNMSQKLALLAMNFPVNQYNKCISVNVYSALRQFYQGCDTNKCEEVNESNAESTSTLKRKGDEITQHMAKVQKTSELDVTEHEKEGKDDDNAQEPKKPKWHFDNIEAAEILAKKMDSLVIVSKEDPESIFLELSKFVKPGRPFVVYNNVVEPLQNLYVLLKCHKNVAALRVTCNWMRNYQILPERTHPEVMMNGSSGFLLTGYMLK